MKKNKAFKALSNVSGLSTETVEKIAKEVIRNNRILNSCSYHIFVPIDDNLANKKYQCVNCGGNASQSQKTWYEQGIEHCQKRIEKE